MIVRRTFPDGQVGFGEVAGLEPVPPVSWRDSPPGAFALWSARQVLTDREDPPPARTAALINLDEATPEGMDLLRKGGFSIFKIKLGTDRASCEADWIRRFAGCLQAGEKLRLDPNRSWSTADWRVWKPVLADLAPLVEFLEEPFRDPPDAAELIRLCSNGPVRLALDESLSGDGIAEWHRLKWPGFFVIKPSLLGDPERWLPLLLPLRHQVIVSSAFETGIGLTAILRLTRNFSDNVHGLGTQSFFNDNLGTPERGDKIYPLSAVQAEELWNNLPAS